MNKVKVVDAICGAGKSTHIINHMRENPDKRWMYVTPYLSEAGDGDSKNEKGRIRESLPELDFQCPSGSKSESLKKILADGKNVAITHALLTLIDKETLEVIKTHDYHLVIDETLDVISVYKGIHSDDIRGMIGNYVIKDEQSGKLTWNYELYGDSYKGHFKELKDLCDMDCLYIHKGNVLINKLSPVIMQSAKSVTVLTYMFEGSFMCAWLRMAGVEYEHVPLNSGFDPEVIKQSVKDNLVVLPTPKSIFNMNYDDRGLVLNGAFSSTWYKGRTAKELNHIKKGVQSSLTQLRKKGIQHKIFWTTFKNYQEVLVGTGYKKGTVVSEDGELVEPFVSKNKRASNTHAECNTCVYLVNVFAHGDIASYLQGQGINVDNDSLAISEMVQFIFRGSIRRGETMYLMVASERMKKLLLEWLEEPS